MNARNRFGSVLGVSDICHDMGISTSTFYKWRVKCGDIDDSTISRVKELEE
jgi:putative transposase